MKQYLCIKCGSLVYWHKKNECFICSNAVLSNYKNCTVKSWIPINPKDEVVEIAKRQGII